MINQGKKRYFIKIESEQLQLTVILVYHRRIDRKRRLEKVKELLKGNISITYVTNNSFSNNPLQEIIGQVEKPYIWILEEDITFGIEEFERALELLKGKKLQFIYMETVRNEIRGQKLDDDEMDVSTAKSEISKYGINLQYDLSYLLFRNPKELFLYQESDWSLETRFGVTRFFLEYASHGYMARMRLDPVRCESSRETMDLWTSVSYDELIEAGRYLKDIYQYYKVSVETISEAYEQMKQHLIQDCRYTENEIYKKISIESILRGEPKPNLLLSIYSFSKGAGELVPLVLANQLSAMGYHVYLHMLESGEEEKLARKLLYPEIYTIQTNRETEIKKLICDFDITVISTHHQANQSFVASLYKQEPELHSYTRHVATTHGMYETFAQDILNYILEVQLKGNIDQWIYVEDKNLAPFQNQSEYPVQEFVKISEETVASILYDIIGRTESVQMLRDLTRLRDGINNLADIAQQYLQVFKHQAAELSNNHANKYCNMTEYKEKKKKTKDGMQTILFPVFEIRYNSRLSLEDKLRSIDHNTGNLLFTHALKEQLNYQEEVYLRGKKIRKTRWKNASAVIPATNYIREENDTVARICGPLLKKKNLPVTLIGLGAQNSSKCNTPKELVRALNRNNIRFLKTIAERAVSLGVRGEFTAACLEELGIYNVRIIGCPSLYFAMDGKFQLRCKPTDEKVVFCVSGGNRMESKIVELGMQQNASWVMQMGLEFNEWIPKPIKIPVSPALGAFPEINIEPSKLQEYQQTNASMFFTMQEWDDYLQRNQFTFSFGSRFHGNVAALRNGIPALFIVHDSRTKELVETMHLPHIGYNELNQVRSIQDLVQACDYEDFQKNYHRLTKNYVDFLEENGLSHKFTI